MKKFFGIIAVCVLFMGTGCVTTGAGTNSVYCAPPDHLSGTYDIPAKKHPDSYSYTRSGGKITVEQRTTDISVERYWNPVKGKWDVLKNVSEYHVRSETPDYSTLPRGYYGGYYYNSGEVPQRYQIPAGTVYGPQKPAIVQKLFGSKKTAQPARGTGSTYTTSGTYTTTR